MVHYWWSLQFTEDGLDPRLRRIPVTNPEEEEEDVDEVIMDLGPPVAALEGEKQQQPSVQPDQHQHSEPVQEAG